MSDRRREKLLPVERWPTAEEAQASRWFSEVQVGPHRLTSRTWVPAMVPWRATGEGDVSDAVVAWYERFAAGAPGVIVIEATGIRDVPSGPLLRAGHERFVPGLTRLVEAVRRASGGRTKLFVQLIDFLAIKRRPTKDAYLGRFLAITPRLRAALGAPFAAADDAVIRAHLLSLPDDAVLAVLDEREREAFRFGYRERVTDTHLPHIAELPRVLPELFADAARRCLEAGFDGIELHFAHAYTLASFLSARNDRADGYGGAREARVRLPLEVYRAVRGIVGRRAALGCRFLTDEIIDGGSRVDDAAFFATRFAEAGMDFLSLSRGGKFEDAKAPKVGQAAYPYTGPSGHECMPTTNIAAPGPFGRNLPAIAAVTRAVRAAGHPTPIVACGGIATFAQAEAVLASKDADLVASARQSLADPDWFLKLRLGRGDEVRRCLFTNYCEGLDQAHEVVTCQLWDRVKGEPDDATVPRTRDGRRLVAPRWSP
ncbi:MAG: NADH:flavin oxidoreductase [Myxococcaceae bacterium]|jgi:2,4-dienoyl-CoA reductase-like NADH-dependent reductase (Old Yellow Enzyme family)|nr:NADH:flavin oxidoreductase [Myxococcaceae bacterium]MCA3011917.1 NADH:flavin oxidoreductase [Myxococcaceae bacterium]